MAPIVETSTPPHTPSPVPYMAVYGATKAFVLSFSEALWVEARGRGVSVLALCPGPTETNFFEVAGAQGLFGRKQSPEMVVENALRSLARGRTYVIPGLGNFLLSSSSRFTPRSLTARIAGRMMRPPQSSVPAETAARRE